MGLARMGTYMCEWVGMGGSRNGVTLSEVALGMFHGRGMCLYCGDAFRVPIESIESIVRSVANGGHANLFVNLL